jgi:hypothetical protein
LCEERSSYSSVASDFTTEPLLVTVEKVEGDVITSDVTGSVVINGCVVTTSDVKLSVDKTEIVEVEVSAVELSLNNLSIDDVMFESKCSLWSLFKCISTFVVDHVTVWFKSLVVVDVVVSAAVVAPWPMFTVDVVNSDVSVSYVMEVRSLASVQSKRNKVSG